MAGKKGLARLGLQERMGLHPPDPGTGDFFDGTITIAELIKWIWKGFRVGFGIGYEGPRNPLSEALNLWPNSSKNHMLFISAPFAFPSLHFPKPRGTRAQGPPLTCRNPRMMMPITPKPGFVSFADSALLVFTITRGAAPGLSTGSAWLRAFPFGRRRLPGGLFQAGIKKSTAGGWDLQDSPCSPEQLRRMMVTTRGSFHPCSLQQPLVGTSFGFSGLSSQSWSSNQHPI